MRLRRCLLPCLLLFACLVWLTMPPGHTQTTPAAGGTAPQRGIWDTDDTAGGTPGQGMAAADGPIDPDAVEVSIAFSKAEIADVLAFLSMVGGVPIVLDGEAKGTITIISAKKMSLTTAYEVINSALRVRGYAMVGTMKDKLIRVVPVKKAIADRADVRAGADATTVSLSDKVVTQVIPLANASAVKLRDELRPMISEDQASLVAVSNSNMLIVTDTEGNIHRLLEVISLLDRDETDALEVEVYMCKYANAGAIATSLDKIFNAQKTAQAAGQRGTPQPPNGAPGTPAVTSPTSFDLKGEIHFASDDRTNSLVIFASRPKINKVLELVKKLDIDTMPEVNAHIFTLKYADAQFVANQLNQLFVQPAGGVSGGANRFRGFFGGGGATPTSSTPGDYAGLKQNTVVADVRTNSVIVTATEQNMKQFETMILQLDSPTVASEITHIYRLKYASAPSMATTLTQLFRGSTSSRNFFDILSGNTGTAGDPVAALRNITVVAEQKSNSLLITGPPQVFASIDRLIDSLDQRTVQVFIEVAIVDVTLDKESKFGVEWKWNSSELGPGGDPAHTVSTENNLAKETLGLKYSVISNNLQALLHTLETRSNVKVYSTPSITTADNVQAAISIGQDIPFISQVEDVNNISRQTVDFKNVSVSLTVTPHVNMTSDLIALDVLQTINEIIGQDQILKAPVIANRSAKTSVMVNDGQTIVIGGIIKENQERTANAVPLLSRIPVLGELFKSRTRSNQKSELMVFLTPHILRTEESINKVYNDARDKLTDADADKLPANGHDDK